MFPTRVERIVKGDMLDLQGDRFADPDRDHMEMEFEYARVDEIEDERPAHSCVVLHTSQGSFGFPPRHRVAVVMDHYIEVDPEPREIT